MTTDELGRPGLLSDVAIKSINCLCMYWHNTDPADIVRAVYTDPAPRYLDEKVRAYQLGLVPFWGQLDEMHRARLLAAAVRRYGDEVWK